ncbi:hypothetical protein Dsin_015763 [Dipteronia sinensis]|uniref:non-specific serine/threonine protein kinase n=1 Tax=Dipteronia sinensis TaxID=43782 RepID=A0AAE0E530_9ROSI|nr:hypothetical protein Dsin_015763 [Dipteronia sinensis]
MQYQSMKLFLGLLFSFLYSFSLVISRNEDSQVLIRVKSDQLHDSNEKLSNWVPTTTDQSPCNWTGITCDAKNHSVVGVDLSNLGISGGFPYGFCRIRTLRNLTLTNNFFIGPLSSHSQLSPCSHLQVLELVNNQFIGDLPDFSLEFGNLEVLDLSENYFSGDIPASFGRFPALKKLNLAGNNLDGSIPSFLSNLIELTCLALGYNLFKPSPLPSSFGNLSKLEILFVANASLVGEIPDSIGKLVSLTNLDLSTNYLSGKIPYTIAGLKSIEQIELYDNQLSGELPESLVNLTTLINFDVSQNNLTGNLSQNIASMNFKSLNLNDNRFTGEIPETLSLNPNLVQLKLFNNSFSGKLPENLGKFSDLEDFDVSTNDFTGELPQFLCYRNQLQNLIIFKNRFSGKIPESYGECKSLSYVRMGNNKLSGEVSSKFWGLSHLEFLEMYNNNFNGPISPSIFRARNLTHLLISGNNFIGQIPSVVCDLHQLEVFDMSHNCFSGEVPSCVTQLNNLETLDLQQNMFTGELPGRLNLLTALTELSLANNRFTGIIPPELGYLPVLTDLDLSNNKLTGEIPVELTKLNLNQFNISNNRLNGKVPYCFDNQLFVSSLSGNPGLCSPDLKPLPPCPGKKPDTLYFASILAICAVLMLGTLLWFSKTKSDYVSKPKRRWKVTTFQRVGFSEEDIFPHLIEENLIGSGASGQVYRVKLKSGQTVAVKRLRGGKLKPETESAFKSETEILGRIRHGNIVKLLLCISGEEFSILVFEYMENASLGDVLHGENGGAGLLDWKTRLTIAMGAAKGLSYLHHDCVPAIVHRDVKSNNILLDAEMVPRVADFGIAKTLQREVGGVDGGDMLRVAGSYGYIAPEYAYSLKVNEKSDVYSFGIVLMELITGKRPNDTCFGENKDIVKWVTEADLSSPERKMTESGSSCCRDLRKLVDPRMQLSTRDYEKIDKVLDVAVLCTTSFPNNRPSMRRVVELLKVKDHKLALPN